MSRVGGNETQRAAVTERLSDRRAQPGRRPRDVPDGPPGNEDRCQRTGCGHRKCGAPAVRQDETGQQQREADAEAETGNVDAHRRTAALRGEGFHHQTHSRYIGAGQPHAAERSQHGGRAKAIGERRKEGAEHSIQDRAEQVDDPNAGNVGEGRQDKHGGRVSDLLAGENGTSLRRGERPLLAQHRQRRRVVAEGEHGEDFGGGQKDEPLPVIRDLWFVIRHDGWNPANCYAEMVFDESLITNHLRILSSTGSTFLYTFWGGVGVWSTASNRSTGMLNSRSFSCSCGRIVVQSASGRSVKCPPFSCSSSSRWKGSRT